MNPLVASLALLFAVCSMPLSANTPSLDVLRGHWVRSDGGYQITINGIGKDG